MSDDPLTPQRRWVLNSRVIESGDVVVVSHVLPSPYRVQSRILYLEKRGGFCASDLPGQPSIGTLVKQGALFMWPPEKKS